MGGKRETGLNPETQAIINEDFGAFSKLILSGKRAPENPTYRAFADGGYDFGMGYDGIQYRPLLRLSESLRRYSPGLVWYAEYSDPEGRKKPYASPEDYIGIRDGYDSLKDFVEKRMDAGKIDTSFGGMGGEDRETSPAVYMQFLYRSTRHEPFKANLERVIVELTRDELALDLENLDPQEARKRVGHAFDFKYDGDIEKYFYFLDGFLHGDTLEGGLDYTKIAASNPDLRTRVIQELTATQRLTTEQEYAEVVEHSTVENSRRHGWYEKAKRDRTLGKLTHFTELSLETKALIKEDLLERQTATYLSDRSTDRYERLTSLLEMVISIGSPNGALQKLYPLLRDAAESGKFRDIPSMKIGAFTVNIDNHILMALATLQQGTELREFWLERIATDPNKFRVLTAIGGLLKMPGDHDKKSEAQEILAAISRRDEALDKDEERSDNSFFDRMGFQFYVDRKLEYIS